MPPHRDSSHRRSNALASFAVIAAGVGVAVQTAINGHTSVATESAVFATAINHTTGLLVAFGVALALGSIPRGAHALRARRGDLRAWWFSGGVMGFCAVLAMVAVTPSVGVVTVGVGVTLGQLAGSILADSRGLGPGGRQSLSVLRMLGVAVAVAAVLFGAARGGLQVENVVAIAVLVAAGAVIAIQQVANSWVVTSTGEFSVMSVINFGLSTVLVLITLAVTMLFQPIDIGAMPAWAPLSGVIGAIVGVISAVAVRRIGVLSVMLGIAAGQAVGSIAVELIAPVGLARVTITSLIAAALAVTAVGLAGLDAVRRGGRASAAGGLRGATPDPLP